VPDEVVVGVAVVLVVSVLVVLVVSVLVVLVVSVLVVLVVSVLVVLVVSVLVVLVVLVVVIVGSPSGCVTEGVTAVELGVANAANEWFTRFWTSPRALSTRDWTFFAGTKTSRL